MAHIPVVGNDLSATYVKYIARHGDCAGQDHT